MYQIQPRDRRRWFAAAFGNSPTKTGPLSSPMLVIGLALPFVALAVLSVVLAAQVIPDAGNVALAVTPAFAVAREQASRLYKEMQALSDKHKETQGAWPSEDQERFDKILVDFTAANNRAMQLQNVEQYADNYLTATAPPPTPVSNPAGETNRKQAHKEAFQTYLRKGEPGLARYANQQKLVQPVEIQALLSNEDTLGGFLVPDDVRAQIIKAESQMAVLAPLCRVENTGRDALVFPKLKQHASDVRRSSGFTGTWRQQGYITGGTAPTIQNQPTFQQERIPVHSWQPDAVEVSPELIEDAEANVEGIIADAIAECRAFDLDDAILNGTGTKEPEGILQAGLTTVNSGGATSIAIGGLIGMYTELPSQYRAQATWVMASRTMGAILQLNTGTGGVYLFPPNQWNNTILGRPVVFLDYGMDTATAAGGTTFTANDNPIIFGDFKRYIIAQRRDLRIQRLVERFAPNVGFLPTSRVGGQVVFTDAFRLMKISA